MSASCRPATSPDRNRIRASSVRTAKSRRPSRPPQVERRQLGTDLCRLQRLQSGPPVDDLRHHLRQRHGKNAVHIPKKRTSHRSEDANRCNVFAANRHDSDTINDLARPQRIQIRALAPKLAALSQRRAVPDLEVRFSLSVPRRPDISPILSSSGLGVLSTTTRLPLRHHPARTEVRGAAPVVEADADSVGANANSVGACSGVASPIRPIRGRETRHRDFDGRSGCHGRVCRRGHGRERSVRPRRDDPA
jgi:hypothetical protein